MKNFKDFGIKPASQVFTGDKIKMERILNRQIYVHDFRLEDSKFKDEKCLYLQISIGEMKHVIFTSSKSLITMIDQVPKSEFPFITTIIKENDRYEFS